MIIYIIIGIIIFGFTTSSMVRKGKHIVKEILLEPAYWIGTAICVIFWPIIIVWALYDGIKLYKDLRGS